MPEFEAHGRLFDMRVIDAKGAAKTEYLDRDGQSWIVAEEGETFTVQFEYVANAAGSRPSGKLVTAALFIDDGPVAENDFTAPSQKDVFHGFLADAGDKYRPFLFGAPGEDASGAGVDALKIEMDVQLSRKENKPYIATASVIPAPKKQKKFFQPHVEAGEEEFSVGGEGVLSYTVKKYGKRVTCAIRYSSPLGLASRNIISHESHPELFSDKTSRKLRASRGKLDSKVKAEPGAVKEEEPEEAEVIEIE